MNSLSFLNLAAKSKAATPSSTTAPPAPIPTETDREKVAALVKAYFGPVQVHEGQIEIGPSVPVPAQVYTHVSSLRSSPPLTLEQIEEARRILGERDHFIEELSLVGHDRVNLAYVTHRSEVADKTLAGQSPSDCWSKADIKEDFSARRAVLKSAALERSRAAGALFAVGAKKVVEQLREHAESVCSEEFKRSAAYGIDFVPSRLVATLMSAASQLERQVLRATNQSAGLGIDPRGLFGMLNIEL